MNNTSKSKFLTRALWRLKNSWHYLLVIALAQILLVVFTALTVKGALLAFFLLILCFALLDSPIEHIESNQPDRTKRKSLTLAQGTLLSSVLEALPDPMLILNTENKLMVANAPARALFSNTEAGQDISAIVRAPQLLDAVIEVSKTREPQIVQLAERIPFERQFSVSIAWLGKDKDKAKDRARDGARDRDGPSILLHLKDLTEQERLNRMRADFIANASHELRTPLASMLGFIDTLQGPARNDEEARDKFLVVMATQGRRMKRLIDDLLSLSRIEMDAHKKVHDRVDITAIIGNTVDIVAPLANEQNIKLIWQKPEGDIAVLGNRDELTQIFQNLVHNAIKYGRDNGIVTITVRSEKPKEGSAPKVIIDVEDDGIGIAAHHIPRLTERFYRVDAEQSRQKGGTGLGLAIAKHIVTHHSGELKISSTPGKGSTFTVILPRAE